MVSPKPSFACATEYCNHLVKTLAETQISDHAGNSLELDSAVSSVVATLKEARNGRSKAMVIGNGGSAAIAAHMQCDLAKGLKVRALTFFDLSFFTATANDLGVELVFEEPVRLFAEPGDMLFAISSSGQSENIVRAARQARAQACQVVTFSGFASDNPLRSMGQINFYVPVKHYGMVELAHQMLIHCITDLAMCRAEDQLYG